MVQFRAMHSYYARRRNGIQFKAPFLTFPWQIYFLHAAHNRAAVICCLIILTTEAEHFLHVFCQARYQWKIFNVKTFVCKT